MLPVTTGFEILSFPLLSSPLLLLGQPDAHENIPSLDGSFWYSGQGASTSGSNTLAIIFLPTVHTVVAWREVRTFVSNDLLPLELSSIDIFFFVNDSSRAKGLNLNEKADGQDLLGPARREPRPCPPNKQPAAAATDTVLSSINIIIYKHNSRVRGNVARPLPSRRETSTGVRFSGVDPEGESRERERGGGSKWRVMSRVCYTHIMPGILASPPLAQCTPFYISMNRRGLQLYRGNRNPGETRGSRRLPLSGAPQFHLLRFFSLSSIWFRTRKFTFLIDYFMVYF